MDGKANDYLIKYLADELKISRGKVQLEKGATSRIKRISIDVTQAKWEEIVKNIDLKP